MYYYLHGQAPVDSRQNPQDYEERRSPGFASSSPTHCTRWNRVVDYNGGGEGGGYSRVPPYGPQGHERPRQTYSGSPVPSGYNTPEHAYPSGYPSAYPSGYHTPHQSWPLQTPQSAEYSQEEIAKAIMHLRNERAKSAGNHTVSNIALPTAAVSAVASSAATTAVTTATTAVTRSTSVRSNNPTNGPSSPPRTPRPGDGRDRERQRKAPSMSSLGSIKSNVSHVTQELSRLLLDPKVSKVAGLGAAVKTYKSNGKMGKAAFRGVLVLALTRIMQTFLRKAINAKSINKKDKEWDWLLNPALIAQALYFVLKLKDGSSKKKEKEKEKEREKERGRGRRERRRREEPDDDSNDDDDDGSRSRRSRPVSRARVPSRPLRIEHGRHHPEHGLVEVSGRPQSTVIVGDTKSGSGKRAEYPEISEATTSLLDEYGRPTAVKLLAMESHYIDGSDIDPLKRKGRVPGARDPTGLVLEPAVTGTEPVPAPLPAPAPLPEN